jgi:hypothetical protein
MLYECVYNVCRRTEELIQRLGVPATDSKPLEFTRQYAQPLYSQFWLLLQKHWRTYWRWPSYNGTRYLLTLGIGVLFTIIFWGLGKNRWVPMPQRPPVEASRAKQGGGLKGILLSVDSHGAKCLSGDWKSQRRGRLKGMLLAGKLLLQVGTGI